VSVPSVPELLVGHWQVDPGLSLIAALYAGGYLWAAHRVRRGWPVRRTVSFLAGIACVLVALESGVDGYDDRLLSVHMVQHLLLLTLAPLLLLCGRPALLALQALPRGPRGRLARAMRRMQPLSGPLPCLALFTVVVLGTHVPGLYDATLRHPPLHDAEHVAYLVAGAALWWPLLDGDPAPGRRLGGLGRFLYLLATMPPMVLIGAYLNRHTALVYTPYGPPAHALGISAIVDQQQAGAIMWVVGSTVMVAAGLWAVIGALLAEERRQQARDARATHGPGAPA
jgi:putative copper resistance protein D